MEVNSFVVHDAISFSHRVIIVDGLIFQYVTHL